MPRVTMSFVGVASCAVLLARAALDLVAPGRCAACGLHRPAPLCELCAGQLRGADPLARWIASPAGALPAFAAAAYDGCVRAALLAYKERGRRDLRGDLAFALTRATVAAAAGGFVPSSALLVPVPSARAAVRERGYDAVALLTSAAARALRNLGFDARVAPVLQQARGVADQAGLSMIRRKANMGGALAVSRKGRDRVRGRAVIVVDDIVTSGATAGEAGRALSEAGAIVAAVVAVAGTPRWKDGRKSPLMGRLDGANAGPAGLG